jgi:hypothetical protein
MIWTYIPPHQVKAVVQGRKGAITASGIQNRSLNSSKKEATYFGVRIYRVWTK